MRTLVNILLLAGMLVTANAATLSFGPSFDKNSVVPVAQVVANPSEYVGKTVTVAGQIQAVCKKKGCWMTLAASENTPEFKIKVRDGDMVFPVSSLGKTALAHGVVQAKPMTLDETIAYFQHLAHEQGKSFNPASVTEPVTLYQLAPTSVEILE